METINLTPTLKDAYDALKSIPIMGTAVICISGRETPITRNEHGVYEINGTTYGPVGAVRVLLDDVEAETEAATLEAKTITLETSHGTPTLKSAYEALQNMPMGMTYCLTANDLVVSVRRIGDHYVVEGDELDRIKALKRVRESLRVENIRFRAHPGDFGRDGRLTMAATRSILTMSQHRPKKTVEVFVNNTVIATVSGSGPFEVEIIGEDTGSCPWSWANASAALRRASKNSFETQVHRFDWTRKEDFLDMVQQGFACIFEFRNGFVAQAARIPDSNRYETYLSSTDCTAEVGMEELVVLIDTCVKNFSTSE